MKVINESNQKPIGNSDDQMIRTDIRNKTNETGNAGPDRCNNATPAAYCPYLHHKDKGNQFISFGFRRVQKRGHCTMRKIQVLRRILYFWLKKRHSQLDFRWFQIFPVPFLSILFDGFPVLRFFSPHMVPLHDRFPLSSPVRD